MTRDDSGTYGHGNRFQIDFYKDAAPDGAGESRFGARATKMPLLTELRNDDSVPSSTKMPLLTELGNPYSVPLSTKMPLLTELRNLGQVNQNQCKQRCRS